MTSWRCRIRLHHWKRLHNPYGGWYRRCTRCHKTGNVDGAIHGGMAGYDRAPSRLGPARRCPFREYALGGQ